MLLMYVSIVELNKEAVLLDVLKYGLRILVRQWDFHFKEGGKFIQIIK